MTRIPELPDELDARQRALYERIASGPRGRVRGPLALWLYSPDLCERAQHLGEFLRFGSSFPPALSEFAILLVSRHFGCDYIWAIHAPIALREGVSPPVVDAIKADRAPEGFDSEEQRLVFAFVRELLRTNAVGEAAFAAFNHRFGPKGVVEITALMGYYALGGYLLNAVAAQPPAA